MNNMNLTNLLLIVAIGLSVACLIKLHRLENTVVSPRPAPRREQKHLPGRGKLVDWPGRRGPQPRRDPR
jgi:hypothetical protein